MFIYDYISLLKLVWKKPVFSISKTNCGFRGIIDESEAFNAIFAGDFIYFRYMIYLTIKQFCLLIFNSMMKNSVLLFLESKFHEMSEQLLVD